MKEYLSKFDVSMSFSQEEAVHCLSPRKNVVYSYVVENPETKEITDFISFYALPSTVIGNEKHNKLNAAYSWYYFSEKTEIEDLFKDAIIMAKKEGFDVFNALNIMDNEEAFETLRFGRGAGSLHYYLFNYRLPNIEPEKIAMVLV